MLLKFKPSIIQATASRTCQGGLQIKSMVTSRSLDKYRRSFLGVLPSIFNTLPSELLNKGQRYGWIKIRKQIKKIFKSIN